MTRCLIVIAWLCVCPAAAQSPDRPSAGTAPEADVAARAAAVAPAGTGLEQRVRLLEDIQAITELKSTYCDAADGGWDRPSHDADKVAALFVEDGVWDGGLFGHAAGREAIRGLFQSFRVLLPFVFHRVTNPIIRVDGNVATGEWHLLAPGIVAATHRVEGWFGGIYHDEFVRTPDGWKFKRLQLTPAFAVENGQAWRLGEEEIFQSLF